MDTDSDSDGSHISATPPREKNPPPPPLQPPPSTLLASYKSRVRVKASPRSAAISKPKSKPKSSSQHTKSNPPPNSDPKPSQQDRLPDPFPLNDLPFQIRRLTDQDRATSTEIDSIENLPAGYFSKFASFSKLRKSCLNLESTEIDHPPVVSSVSTSQSGKVSQDAKGAAANVGNSTAKVVRKHSNLIGGSVDVLPAKRLKGANEGNFVRLNINGYGNKRKFMNKGGRRNQFSSSGRRNFRRYKKKTKAKGDGNDDEAGGSCDEDGLVSETVQNLKEERGDLKYDCELIEEAVMACRDEASDENLVKLLKVVYGYDSFRDGQLEAIKMVLSGNSTMLVLPTGAGKSLCYQLPAMILPGITLVVSPLVALMIDQLKQLPPMIQGGLLSSSQVRCDPVILSITLSIYIYIYMTVR